MIILFFSFFTRHNATTRWGIPTIFLCVRYDFLTICFFTLIFDEVFTSFHLFFLLSLNLIIMSLCCF